MAAMTPAKRGQFLSRVLGYEKLRSRAGSHPRENETGYAPQ